MNNVTQKLDAIIRSRQSRIPVIEKAMQNLEQCLDSVDAIQRIKTDLDSEESRFRGLFGDEAAMKIRAISLDGFYKQAQIYKAKLQQLQKRFGREQLHISLVGSARQGKSLVIQNISGLDPSIIPSSDGNDCTGAKSVITNSESEEVNAKIVFYNEREMIDIINKYLEGITHSSQYNIYSLHAAKAIPLEQIKQEVSRKVDEQALVTHLRNYIRHMDELCPLLGKTITVPKEEIEKYVAQYKHDDFSVKYWNYLGVKTADIHCRFPYSDAGKIVLLDTIGIGTTSLGVESSMLDTVENDSDAIIFMFRPDPLGPRLSSTETYIMNKISERVGSDYAKEMLFWVINRVEEGKGRNVDYISGVREQISDAEFPVSETLEVNCLSRQAVEEQLLMPVLNKMGANIDRVDQLLLHRADDEGAKLFEEYSRIAAAFERGRISSISADIKRKLNPQIRQTYQKLLNKLRDLYLDSGKYGKLRNQPCQVLQEGAEKILRQMFTFVPPVDEIMELLNMGTVNQHNALEKCTDRIRLETIDAFNGLNMTLHTLIKEMKTEVLDIFTSEDMGRLAFIEHDTSVPEDWIKCFLDKIKENGEYPIISNALMEFSNFNCSVQGFLIYEVRNQLDGIDFSLAKQPPGIVTGPGNKEKLAREIHEKLLNEVEKVHTGVESAIRPLFKVPNRAMFAAIKDLYDRCAYEDRSSRTDRPVEEEWRYLYESWIADIWSQEYNEYSSAQGMAEELKTLIECIRKCNNKDCFRLTI